MPPEQAFTIFDIPDFLQHLALRYLSAHDRTLCLRVSRQWYQDFLPFHWRQVRVFDLDYNHLEYCCFGVFADKSFIGRYCVQGGGHPGSRGEWEGEEKRAEVRGEGLHCASKYSHWIREIQCGSLKSLEALGDKCVNLTRLEYDPEAGMYGIVFESSSGRMVWTYENVMEMRPRTNRVWKGLIDRNLGLRRIKMSVNSYIDEGEDLEEEEDEEEEEEEEDSWVDEEVVDSKLQGQVVEGLTKLKDLQELELSGPFSRVQGWVQMLEDGCPSLKRLIVNGTLVLPRD